MTGCGCPQSEVRLPQLAASFIFKPTSFVAYWPIPSFRCAADLGRYRGIADIEQDALLPLQLQPRIFSQQISSIGAVARTPR
jgi:hypothetical protein